jgi:hypothetical protein
MTDEINLTIVKDRFGECNLYDWQRRKQLQSNNVRSKARSSASIVQTPRGLTNFSIIYSM